MAQQLSGSFATKVFLENKRAERSSRSVNADPFN
jgi:hypothetical protein